MSFVDSTLPPGFELKLVPTTPGVYAQSYKWACGGTASASFSSSLLATRDAWTYWSSLILGKDVKWVPTDPDDSACDTFTLTSNGGDALLCRNEKLAGERYWIEIPLAVEPRWWGDDEVEAMARFAGIVLGMDGMSK